MPDKTESDEVEGTGVAPETPPRESRPEKKARIDAQHESLAESLADEAGNTMLRAFQEDEDVETAKKVQAGECAASSKDPSKR